MKRESEKSVRPQDGLRFLPVSAILAILLAIPAVACNKKSEAREDPSRPSSLAVSKSSRLSDTDADGIPDGIELRSSDDRLNFRRWFTAIAETQFYEVSGAWSSDQQDCAGLVRFAWRESLRHHDRVWFKSVAGFINPIAPDIRAYRLDDNVLGEKLFRTNYGSFRETDLNDGTFSEFADARTLKNYNVSFVGRDREQAQSGDLLFFHQPWVQRFPFHVMIFLGEAREENEDAHDWVVYHTGNTGHDGQTRRASSLREVSREVGSRGENDVIKKVRLSVLDHHPNRKWRPVPQNPNFLGFFRLKILD